MIRATVTAPITGTTYYPAGIDVVGAPRDAGDELWEEAYADAMLRTGARYESPDYTHPGAP